MQIIPLQASYNYKEEFFLFGTVLEASMIEKRFVRWSGLNPPKSHQYFRWSEKSIVFEISLGNAGNSTDGFQPLESYADLSSLDESDGEVV